MNNSKERLYKSLNLKAILEVFCSAVDQINPILKNHHRRVAVISYQLGKELELKPDVLTKLVIAASMHDIGALTVEDRDRLMAMDVENPEPHEKMGESMLIGFKPFYEVSKFIRFHHVDYKKNLNNRSIPFESYIMHVADRIEVLLSDNDLALNQAEDVSVAINELSGTKFHPVVIEAFNALRQKEFFWFEIDNTTTRELFYELEFDPTLYKNDYKTMEELVHTLSNIVDYKSEFTATHSKRVAHVAGRICDLLAYDPTHKWEVKMAAYMHDFGKIAVPSELINKSGRLTKVEFNIMKTHPYYTYKILKDIDGFERICKWASNHHEKMDGSGYPRKPDWSEKDQEMEIIIYSDVFAALSENRPYREGLSVDVVMKVIDKQFREIVGEEIYAIVKEHHQEFYEEVRAI